MQKLVLGWFVAALFAAAAHAQTPYRIIVPTGPGTGNDVLFRAFAQHLSAELQAPVVVENRAGADGAIAVREVGRVGVDGRTLLAVTDNMFTINHLITPYDPKVVRPVAWLTRSTAALVVRADGKYRTLEDLLMAARQKPDTVPIGTGAGLYRFNLPLMEAETRSRFNEIPYKGNVAAIMTDLLGGTLDVTFLEVGGALGQLQSGRLKAVAVLSTERSPALPDVPTIGESGYPGYSMNLMFGLAMSSGAPPEAAKLVEAAALRAIRSKAMKDLVTQRGQQVYGVSGDEVAPALEKSSVAFRELSTRGNFLERLRATN